MSQNDDKRPGAKDHPDVIGPPPLLYGGALAAGFGIDQLAPLPILSQGDVLVPAAVLIGFALVLGGWCVVLFLRAKTGIPPHLPTTTIVTEGPYRLSRNPIYLALTMLSVGIAIGANSFWMLGLLMPTMVLMSIAVIGPEERYLEAKFGAAYLDYKSKVRRWI
jgi:protein-S-isoprenylcysteine O-methyltransferase Ste14